jgi:hypothetical protein
LTGRKKNVTTVVLGQRSLSVIPGFIIYLVHYSRTYEFYASFMGTTATKTKVFCLKPCGYISYNNSLSRIFQSVIQATCPYLQTFRGAMQFGLWEKKQRNKFNESETQAYAIQAT